MLLTCYYHYVYYGLQGHPYDYFPMESDYIYLLVFEVMPFQEDQSINGHGHKSMHTQATGAT